MTLRILGILNDFTNFLLANLGKPIGLSVLSKWHNTVALLTEALEEK